MSISGQRGFTLMEILVASTIFVSLMGMVTFAFDRISNGGKKGLQILELHTRADAILRYMEADVRNTPNIAALHLQKATLSEPGTFTFMKQVNDTHPYFTHLGHSVPDHNPFESTSGQSFRLTDLIWVRWEWENGSFRRGQSRINQRKESGRQWASGSNDSPKRYASVSMRWVREVIIKRGFPLGIQTNGIPPTFQRHYDFFEGQGTAKPIDAVTGEVDAGPGDKINIYKVVGGAWQYTKDYRHLSEIFDWEDSPWRTASLDRQGGDLRHLYTTLECGNEDPLTDPNAYAVRNQDGKSINKDRLNLVGADDEDAFGQKIYPCQIYELFSGLEYVEIDLIKQDGKVLREGDDTNRLADAQSLDISGVDPLTGDGKEQRPAHVRISYLLHSIPLKELDDLDFDADGDTAEPLMQAIRDQVKNDAYADQAEKVQAFKSYALKHGYTSIFFSQSILIGQ